MHRDGGRHGRGTELGNSVGHGREMGPTSGGRHKRYNGRRRCSGNWYYKESWQRNRHQDSALHARRGRQSFVGWNKCGRVRNGIAMKGE